VVRGRLVGAGVALLVACAAAGTMAPHAVRAASDWQPGPGLHVMQPFGSPARTPAPHTSAPQMVSHAAPWAPTGTVLQSPGAYVIFWGSEWQTGFTVNGYTNVQAMTYVQDLFNGIGGSSWANIDAQYCMGVAAGTVHCPSTAALVGNPSTQLLAAPWVDSGVAVPGTPSNSDIANEAIRATSHFGYNPHANYLVFTPTGKSTAGFGSGFCAWHSGLIRYNNVSHSYEILSFSNIPYQPDQPSTCGRNFVNMVSDLYGHGEFDGLSIVAGHEYAESVTDPDATSGWYDTGSVFTGEIGDKCAWDVQTQNVTLGGKDFAMQPLWSNYASSGTGGCAIGMNAPGAPTAVSAAGDDGSAAVTWTPPASDGGAPIISYTIKCSPACTPLVTGGFPATVTGLAFNQSYTFTVSATNIVGTGPPSASSAPTISGRAGAASSAYAPPPSRDPVNQAPSLPTPLPRIPSTPPASKTSPAPAAASSDTALPAGLQPRYVFLLR
jgi:hypothetical protein